MIKICGLNDAAAVEATVDAGADLAGFVFFEKSPRHVGLETARALAGRLKGGLAPRTRAVALVVDADDAAIAAIIAYLDPAFLQLHGDETPARVRDIRQRFARPVIKALGVRDRGDLARAAEYAPVCDMLVFDAKPPQAATRPGGLGVPFDWAALDGFQSPAPWLLSGGLTPDTVAAAIAATGAPGVDVSSGVERAPGVKDAARVRAFVDAAARALSSAAARG